MPISSYFDVPSCIHPSIHINRLKTSETATDCPSHWTERFKGPLDPENVRKEVTAGPIEGRLKKREGQKKRNSSIPETIKLWGESTLADEMEELKQTNSRMGGGAQRNTMNHFLGKIWETETDWEEN